MNIHTITSQDKEQNTASIPEAPGATAQSHSPTFTQRKSLFKPLGQQHSRVLKYFDFIWIHL